MGIPERAHFENAYAGQAPWDIGRPQPSLIAVADRISGSVLDAGCGTGDNALFFASRGCSVTGIDYLAEPIRRAKVKAVERGLEVNFLTFDATALDTLPQLFDHAIDCGLFHCFNDADRAKYVAGLTSVVKPNGRLFLLCFSDEEPGDQGPRRISRADLAAAFASHWELEAITPTRFEVRPNMPELNFSPGGPRAWFVVARRV